MEMSNEEFQNHLCVLKIEKEVSEVTKRDVNVAFRQVAKILHPDKFGDESTKAAFQELLDSFNKLTDHFANMGKTSDECPVDIGNDDRFLADNFHRFNFPYENKGSFTVSIEDFLADTWHKCLIEHLGEPRVIVNDFGTECDRY